MALVWTHGGAAGAFAISQEVAAAIYAGVLAAYLVWQWFMGTDEFPDSIAIEGIEPCEAGG